MHLVKNKMINSDNTHARWRQNTCSRTAPLPASSASPLSGVNAPSKKEHYKKHLIDSRYQTSHQEFLANSLRKLVKQEEEGRKGIMEITPPNVSNSLCRTIVNTTQAPSAIGPYNQVLHFKCKANCFLYPSRCLQLYGVRSNWFIKKSFLFPLNCLNWSWCGVLYWTIQSGQYPVLDITYVVVFTFAKQLFNNTQADSCFPINSKLLQTSIW